MKKLPAIERRTALKTIGAGLVGSPILTGSVKAGSGRGRGPKNVVTIEAGHEHPDEEGDDPEWWLDIDKQEIPGGWTTLKFDNQTDHLHFGYMVKVSESVLYDEEEGGAYESPGLIHFGPKPGKPGQWGEKWRNAVNLPFQEAWDPYYDRKTDVVGFFGGLEEHVADWFFAPGAAEPVGGPGFTGGGVTSTTTQRLDEGVYILECYVLDEDGRFHSPYGMVEHIEVTDEEGKGSEPSADVTVSIDSEDGIVFGEDDLKPGRYTIGITFGDNTFYHNFLGHDVQLLRKDDVEDGVLEYWMDYLDPVPGDIDGEETLVYGERGALVSTHDDPGPETFLGGVQDIYAGKGGGFVEDSYPVKAYFDVTLKPGEYAWVAEVPNPEKAQPVNPETLEPVGDTVDMLETFEVTPPGQG